jgi:hypothetical protein
LAAARDSAIAGLGEIHPLQITDRPPPAACIEVVWVAALIGIKRWPAGQTRGRHRVQAAIVEIVRSAGVLPVSHFLFGRHRLP